MGVPYDWYDWTNPMDPAPAQPRAGFLHRHHTLWAVLRRALWTLALAAGGLAAAFAVTYPASLFVVAALFDGPPAPDHPSRRELAAMADDDMHIRGGGA